MKLTKEQIQQLYTFTRQHYVEHFDVQTELVDHLANDIEQIWQEKPNLSFEDARTISFKKFGVFGFMDVVAERQKALSKKYWKIIWRFAKDWFQLPKIILTALIFVSLFVGIRSFYGKYFLYVIFFILFIFTFYKGFLLQKHFKTNFKKTSRKWMLEEMIFKSGMGTFALLIANLFNMFNLTNFTVAMIKYDWVAVGFSLFFTALILLLYVVIEVLPKKAEQLLTENYPEYKITTT
jgi:hypothetical protein